MDRLTIDTPHGQAAAHLARVGEPRGAVVLGHGAGGGVTARDLVAVAETAAALQLTVALVEQPYRVAGRRAPPRAPTLDAAWLAVLDQLGRDELAGLPLVVGGRSSGARVACRTSASAHAVGVLCLAFPLRPPRRRDAPPAPSRLGELDAVQVPVLVVQGANDPFGVPLGADLRTVVTLEGDHSLRSDLPGLRTAVADWLSRISAGPARST